MKNKSIFVLFSIIFIAFSFFGCSSSEKEVIKEKEEVVIEKTDIEITTEKDSILKEADEKEIKAVSEEEIYLEDGILNFIFPQNIGNAWVYEGTAEFGSYQWIADVEDTENNSTIIYIESEIEDVSGGEGLDHFDKTIYEVFDDKILKKFANVDSVVLMEPILKNKSWETKYFDDDYGLFDGKVTILEVSESSIITLIEPKNPVADGIPEGFKIRTVYEIGKGITEITKTYVYFYDGVESLFDFSMFMYDFYEEKSEKYINKYFTNDKYLNEIFANYEFNNMLETNERKWLYSNRFNLSPMLIEEEYERFVNSLYGNGITEINLAKYVLQLFSSELDNSDRLIEIFMDFYDDEIFRNREILSEKWFDLEEISKNMEYVEEDNHYEFKEISREENPYFYLKKSILLSNGVKIYFNDGKPEIKTSYDYLHYNFYEISSVAMKEYIDLIKWKYDNQPIRINNIVRVRWDEIGNYIYLLDEFANLKYSKTSVGERALNYADYLFDIYITPNVDNINAKYVDGVILEDVFLSYKEYYTRYPESKYSEILKFVCENLIKNDYKYNLELDIFLIKNGYKPKLTSQ